MSKDIIKDGKYMISPSDYLRELKETDYEEYKKQKAEFNETTYEAWRNKKVKAIEILERNQDKKEKQQIQQIMALYEFNPNNVAKLKPFVMLRMNSELFGYGLLLPKYVEKKDKNGNVLYTEQIPSQVLICSDTNLYPISKKFEEKHKIRFESECSDLNLRWSLPSIKEYLKGDSKNIQGTELFLKIKNLYENYLYFHNSAWYSIHSLWDIGTYFFILFKAYPIFELRGLQGTAKTKIMSISNSITFNACNEIMVNPSESTLFRETHSKRITKYIDEAEKLFTFVKGKLIADDRISFINQSYSCKGAVPRQEKIGNKFVTIYYKSYSPTMIGSINGLQGATENRSIIHITTKNPPEDKRGDKEPETEAETFQEIRNQLYLFALQNWKMILEQYENLENDTKLKSRDFQIWKPLLAISKYLGTELYENTKKYAEKLTSVKEESVVESSKEHKILVEVWKIINQEGYEGKVLVKDIWGNYPDIDYKPSKATIGRCLNSFGFMENKVHTREGNGYEISKKLFENVILPIFPSFHSQHSHTEEKKENSVKVSEEVVQNVNEKCEGNEGNEQCEGGYGTKFLDTNSQSLLNYIKSKSKDNAVFIEEVFPKEIIEKMLREGRIAEYQKGTYSIVK